MSVIYTTYDNKFRDYLLKLGIKDILTGRHIKTGKRFWVYERNEKFNELLKRWKEE